MRKLILILSLMLMPSVSSAGILDNINGTWSTKEGCEWKNKASVPGAILPDKIFNSFLSGHNHG